MTTVHKGIDRLTAQFPWLDSWHFWVGIAYFGLVGVTVALWINFSRVDRQAQARHADIVANADSQYTQCVTSIPTLERINRFIAGVEETNAILLRNSLASHDATPPGTPLYQAQIANISRFRDALQSAKGVRFPIPTLKSCLALRTRLVTSR
jgi:hypothetical protein